MSNLIGALNRFPNEDFYKSRFNNATIEKQAKVIKDNWSELQTLKRILIDEYPDTWKMGRLPWSDKAEKMEIDKGYALSVMNPWP